VRLPVTTASLQGTVVDNQHRGSLLWFFSEAWFVLVSRKPRRRRFWCRPVTEKPPDGGTTRMDVSQERRAINQERVNRSCSFPGACSGQPMGWKEIN
jgi:hypothetical protein